MGENRFPLSEYKGVWLLVLFDLPVLSTDEKRNYVRFRNALIQDGFSMLQYSVYARYCASEEAGKVHRKRVRALLPPKGHVRLLAVTDRQFAKMENYIGKSAAKTEEPPDQLFLL